MISPLFANSDARIDDFRKSEDGALTALGLYLFVAMAMIGAIAVDVSNLFAARSQLQVAADTAGHAALYFRDRHDAAASKVKAVEMARAGMPHARYGNILVEEDITFGSWDYDTQVFTPDANSRESVMVATSRISDKSNSIGSLLFQFIGKSDWDVITPAVFTTFRPTCFREGLVGDGVVDIQSNNGFTNGFCVHSNEYVSVNSNNIFESGTIVSMPNSSDIDLPRSGFETNDGLQAALRSGVYRLRILNKLNDIEDDLLSGDLTAKNMPDFITDATVVPFRGNNTRLDETDFTPGRVHTLNCGQGGRLTLTPSGSGTPFSTFALVTNCEIKFAQGTVLEDVVIFTNHTGSRSMNSPSSFQIGRDDNCADGGGARLLTRGSVVFAAGLKVFGSQVLALHDIEFEAIANGIMGLAMVAGGTIDATSNSNMGFCGSGMGDNYEAEYFRLAI